MAATRTRTRSFVASAAVGLIAAGCSSTTGDGGRPAGGASTTITSITDGDTLRAGEDRIRLIQIDTPETEAGAECYGEEATRALEELVPPGSRVRLVPDRGLDNVDQYGRLLRYVWRGEQLVQLELIRRGAAAPFFYRGERGTYARKLLRAARRAQRERRGAWGACPDAELDPGRGWNTGPDRRRR